MKHQKGQISPLAMWLMGGLGTVILAFGGWTVNQVGGVESETQENTNRIIRTETKVENVEKDITEINDNIKAIRMLLENL